jgi:5-enolpyruvylshikimate-3-phosphate synthase
MADNKKNIEKFRGMRHKETERIVKEILKLNGMTVKAEAEAKKD